MKKRTLAKLTLIALMAAFVSGDNFEAMHEANTAIRWVGAALGVLMFAVQGLKWLSSDTPEGRADAKKGMIYVIVGLLFLRLAFGLTCGLYGAGVAGFELDCTVTGLKCECAALASP